MDSSIRVRFADCAEVLIEPAQPERERTSAEEEGAPSLVLSVLHNETAIHRTLTTALKRATADTTFPYLASHGARSQFTLEFGVDFDTSSRSWVIHNHSAQPVYRLILIIDTCQSGHALTPEAVTAEVAAQSMIEQNMDALIKAQGEPTTELPIMVYIGGDADDASLSPVEEAVRGVLDAYDLELGGCQGPFYGSITKWFKGLKRGGKTLAASELGQDLAADAQRALQLRAVDLEQAKVDDAKATAVAKLIEAAAPHAVVTIQAGSMLLLKAHDMLHVRDLTPREMLAVRRNSHLVPDPKALLAVLDSCECPEQLVSGSLPELLARTEDGE